MALYPQGHKPKRRPGPSLGKWILIMLVALVINVVLFTGAVLFIIWMAKTILE